MQYAVPTFVFATLFLIGCQQGSLVTENSSMPTSSVVSGGSSSMQYVHWTTYQDTKLGIRIDYPSDEYSVTSSRSDDYIQFGDKKIVIEETRIGDAMPEGNSVRIDRTKDKKILDHLKEQNTFTEKRIINGIAWQQFECTGGCMANWYGYVTEKNGWYYVFESSWGPNNPVAEKMLQSLIFNSQP